MSTEAPAAAELHETHLDRLREEISSTPVCIYAQVSISNWKVAWAQNGLTTAAQLTPAEGWSLARVAIAVSNQDITNTYCISNTSFGTGASGKVSVSALTALYNPEEQGNTVTGVVSGWLWGPDGKRCAFWNQETFTL